MELFYKNLANLLKVKTLVTLTLTIVFAIMSCTGTITTDFMTVYLVIVSFYFGTQSIKGKVAADYGINVEDE